MSRKNSEREKEGVSLESGVEVDAARNFEGRQGGFLARIDRDAQRESRQETRTHSRRMSARGQPRKKSSQLQACEEIFKAPFS